MTHTIRVVPGGNPPDVGSPADLATQLQGLISQAGALSTAGVGLPGLQTLGGQINTSASGLTSGAGGSFATTIAGLGTTMSTASMGSMSALVSSMNTAMTSLMSAINPGGLISQIAHHQTMDATKGITTGVFQDQHKTTWDSNGITHSSGSRVTLTAPSLPFNGPVIASDTAVFTGSVSAPSFPITSDARLKSNIAELPPTLDELMKVAPKRFHKKLVRTGHDGNQSVHEDGIECIGVIAQELREIFPELVHGDEAKEFLSVNEGGIAIVTLAALQEFVTETRREIAELKKREK